MKLIATTVGDSSVGIRPTVLTLDLGMEDSNLLPMDDSLRAQWRRGFGEFVAEMTDERIRHVHFDDECDECGAIEGHHDYCPLKPDPTVKIVPDASIVRMLTPPKGMELVTVDMSRVNAQLGLDPNTIWVSEMKL